MTMITRPPPLPLPRSAHLSPPIPSRQERRAAILKKRAEERARSPGNALLRHHAEAMAKGQWPGPVEAGEGSSARKDSEAAAAAAGGAGGVRFSIDEDEAAQVRSA